jgi:hypothetical protein
VGKQKGRSRQLKEKQRKTRKTEEEKMTNE